MALTLLAVHMFHRSRSGVQTSNTSLKVVPFGRWTPQMRGAL